MHTHVEIHNEAGRLYENVLAHRDNDNLVILCHGYQGNMHSPHLESIADRLYGHKVSTFRFSLSDAYLPGDRKDIALHVRDIGRVVNHFKNTYQTITVVGTSFSGFTTAIAATKFPRIDRLVEMNGLFDLGSKVNFHTHGWKGLMYRLSKDWRYYKDNYKPENIETPVLVLHAENDEVVPIAQGREFFDRVHTHATFLKIRGADHMLSTAGDISIAAEAIAKWLRKKVI